MPRSRLPLIPLFLLPVIGLAVLVYYLVVALDPARDPNRVATVMIDQPVPSFALPPLDGERPGLASTDLDGVVLINFFASWCIPCRVEHPLLTELAKSGVVIHGIAYKDKPEDARAWLNELGNPYTRIGADSSGRVAIDFGVYGVPETYVVDRQGRIRFRQVGPFDPTTIEERLKPLLRELQP
jgi:cytochrome c biogenesis protein CcmG/thiol:disulfide interchange protein DsbE